MLSPCSRKMVREVNRKANHMAIAYVPYLPDPMQGQALLNNFTRTRRVLRYRESGRDVQSVERGMPLYEVELTETVGEPNSGNMLMRGECVSACAHLAKLIRSGEIRPIDLVYIDPPFASEANYAKQVYVRRNPELAQKVAQEERQMVDDELRAFEEVMYGDIWDKERYLSWMYQNLMAIRSVMAPDASIYVHLDWHIGAYVKVLMDEVFGEANFRAEIIWKRSTAHSDSEYYGNNFDKIYFYAMGAPAFNTVYQPYEESYLRRFTHMDPDGRKWDSGNLTAKGLRGGGYEYEYKGCRSLWRCPIETMQRMDREGRLHFTKNGGIRSKVYLDELPGMPAQALWTDIQPVNSQASERVAYATQKPEALLERIVKASSDEGMLVADFFGGSGTTAVVCAKNRRNFIHVDVGINSLQVARDRLRCVEGASFDVCQISDGVELFRNPQQTMEKICDLIPGLSQDTSLGEPWIGAFHTGNDGVVPAYVPNLMDSSLRFMDEVTLMRLVNEDVPKLPGEVRKVVVFFVDIVDEERVRQFLYDHNDTLVEVELRDLKPLLAGAVMSDDFGVSVEPDASVLLDGFVVRVEWFASDRLAQKIADFNAKGALGKKRFKQLQISDNALELIERVSADCTADEGPWHADSEVLIDRNGFVVCDGKPTSMFWDGTLRCEQVPLRIRVRNICGDETTKQVRA